MNAICLVVAGVVRATLPGPELALAWSHSVEKTRWEETYRVEGERLRLVEARVEGGGAGVEVPPGAVLRDGRWTWRPDTLHAEVRLTHSSFTRDYMLCAEGRCATLGERTGPAADGEVVVVRACTVPASSGREQVGR